MSKPKVCKCGKRRWTTNDEARRLGWVYFWGDWICDYCTFDALYRVRFPHHGPLDTKDAP